ncbi:MAG: aromatic ring-hydroxylating dioxygenase subunit alpha [Novosphingobium sp.]|nr:aromatic ring-hydroxylating dioxygenase subunit alpha [Novosphingobium sp.]
MATQLAKPGERVDNAPLSCELDLSGYRKQIPTDRYHSRDYNQRERENLWMRVWQIAGRAEEIPEAGDFMEYRLFDQSFVLVRGRDDKVRGFVNACRHRGNAFCEGRGNAPRFTCPYHNWSYGLDGQCLSVAKPDFDGTTEEFVGDKNELGLIEVQVECFAGFVFLNPDPDAPPLDSFLGDAKEMLTPYRIDEMVALGMNLRESIDCNWKVVMDAFQEGYHVQGVHPELAHMTNLGAEHCSFVGDHAVTAVPFAASMQAGLGLEAEVEGYLNLPVANFPGFADALPRLAEIVAGYRKEDGTLELPSGATPIGLLQQAVREKLEAKGLDVGNLTDGQMSDYQYWFLFPNVFLQVRSGDGTAIIAEPHPSGDPTRCNWRVFALMWLPPEEREAQRTQYTDIAEDDHFPYFLALEQDFVQMAIQQRGLNSRQLPYMVLTKQEPKIHHFHDGMDRWVEGAGEG